MATDYDSGDVELFRYPFPASVAFTRFDAVGQISNVVQGADHASFWSTNLATSQALFQDAFLGLSNVQRLASQTDTPSLDICGGGRFWFDCAALGAALYPGNYMGMAKQSGNLLERQKVVSVATAGLAIGTLVRPAAAGDVRVLVEIISTLTRGGVQTPI